MAENLVRWKSGEGKLFGKAETALAHVKRQEIAAKHRKAWHSWHLNHAKISDTDTMHFMCFLCCGHCLLCLVHYSVVTLPLFFSVIFSSMTGPLITSPSYLALRPLHRAVSASLYRYRDLGRIGPLTSGLSRILSYPLIPLGARKTLLRPFSHRHPESCAIEPLNRHHSKPKLTVDRGRSGIRSYKPCGLVPGYKRLSEFMGK